MKKLSKKNVLIMVILVLLILLTGKGVRASEDGFEVEMEKQGSGSSIITIHFDEEIDTEKFSDSMFSRSFEIVDSKTIKTKEAISGFASGSGSIDMKDGTELYVWYSTSKMTSDNQQDTTTSNTTASSATTKKEENDKIKRDGDTISGEEKDIKWVYDTKSKSLIISGSGTITSDIIGTDVPEFTVDSEGNWKEVDKEESGKFIYLDDVESIKIEKGIKSIDWGTFNGCDSLKTLEIENGLKEIPMSTFSGCFKLEKAIIPSSVKRINELCFRDSKDLTIYCVKDSEAHKFAQDHKFKYELIEETEQQEETKENEKKEINVYLIVAILAGLVVIVTGAILVVKFVLKK